MKSSESKAPIAERAFSGGASSESVAAAGDLDDFCILQEPVEDPGKTMLGLQVVMDTDCRQALIKLRKNLFAIRLALVQADVHLVVGLWDAPGDLNKAKVLIGDSSTAHVVTTLVDAQEKFRTLIQPHLAPCES